MRVFARLLLALCCIWVSVPCLAVFDAGLSGYTVDASSRQSNYRLMSFFVLPNEKLEFKVTEGKKALLFTLQGEKLAKTALNKSYTWLAPKVPGYYRITVTPESKSPSDVLIFVMHPAADVKNAKLGNYTIGKYPSKRLDGLDIYAPPKGFVQVTQAMQNLQISPHYTLGQFLCKQKEGFPKYIVLQTQLLNKLELLTQEVNKQGIATNGFVIMSGYRTPHYGKQLGSKTYSRHLWGGAADIFVDEHPKDGKMDDLNKDGKIDEQDAKVLGDIVDKLNASGGYDELEGGMGLYKANAHHGPFVHVDVRGFKVRW